MTQKPALLWAATPDRERPVTLVELTSCLTCSRIIERVVRDEHRRMEPFEDAGEYEWVHQHSQALACDEKDTSRGHSLEHATEVGVSPRATAAQGPHAEIVRLRGIINRILLLNDFTAAQQASIRREAGIADG